MESNKLVYNSFVKLAISMAVANGMTQKKAKQLVSDKIEKHPFKRQVDEIIDKTKLDKTSIKILSKECISLCEDFGPDRDYITLVLILEEVFEKDILEGTIKEKVLNEMHYFRKEVTRINDLIAAPPSFNMLLEGRSLIEWTSMLGIYHFIPKHKSSKNKPVLLMPPYLGNDYSTFFVRKYLKSVGFKTYKWELGVNMINSKYLPKLVERLDQIFEKHQEKVSLVGWSGGGIFAKIIANRYPDKVEQLITIGSPVWGVNNMETPLLRVLEFLRGKTLKERNKKFLKELEEIPNVPVTCIYTKTDGLVPWKHCREASTLRKDIKNIEVFGSHSGMGANATVLLTVANTLNYNINGLESKGVLTKIESMFFPKFWKQKGTAKFTKLFVKT